MIYTGIYTKSYISIYTNFEVLTLKISSEGITLVKMGVTKPLKGLNQQVAPTQTPRSPTKS